MYRVLGESKTGDGGNNDISLTMQLLKKKTKIEELNKQLQQKEEILKEAEGVILQIENIRNASVEIYQSKIEQLENKNSTNDKIIKSLEENLKSAQEKNASLTQKMCQLELENVEYQNEVSRLKEKLMQIQLENVEQKSLRNRHKNRKLTHLKQNVKELRLHFKMCDDIANIKLANQSKVIHKLSSELNEMKDMEQKVMKKILNYVPPESETNEFSKKFLAYDTPMFWQIILRDHKSYELRLISTPKNIICHCEAQMSYTPQVQMPCKGVTRKTLSITEVNVDHEQQKRNFSKILRAFGRCSVHGVQIGAFIYMKYLNIGRIDDSITTLNYLKNMSIWTWRSLEEKSDQRYI